VSFPHKDVVAFVTATAETQECMRACAALDRGKDGPSQSPSVRALLVSLERRTLARYDERRQGWYLTETGKLAAKVYLRVGRLVRKDAEKRKVGGS